jgi:hypothetical protein
MPVPAGGRSGQGGTDAAGFGSLGEDYPRQSPYVCPRRQGQHTDNLPSAHARSTHDLGVNRLTGAPRYHQSTRFEVKELGEINMVPTAHLAGMFRGSADQR